MCSDHAAHAIDFLPVPHTRVTTSTGISLVPNYRLPGIIEKAGKSGNEAIPLTTLRPLGRPSCPPNLRRGRREVVRMTLKRKTRTYLRQTQSPATTTTAIGRTPWVRSSGPWYRNGTRARRC